MNNQDCEDKKRLIPIKLSMKDNNWDFKIDYNNTRFVIKTVPEKVRTAILRLKCRDGLDNTRSHKTIPYMNMLKNLGNGQEVTLHTWKSRIPFSQEDFEKLFR